MSLPKKPFAVVTGAASGFGRALALELAGRGGELLLADVNVAGAEETASLAKSRGARDARAMRCDVSKVEDVQALSDACADAHVDLVVNNAGVSSGGRIGESPLEDWRWTIDVDLWGVIYGCHVFAPRLKKQKSGHVLNVASAAGLLCAPAMGAYNVAKAGVIALSETLNGELVGTGANVTVVCPTFFKTAIVEGGRFADPKLRSAAERLIAAGKDADDIARAALRSCERNELYCVPMSDGRWMWRVKRAIPGSYGKVAGLIAKRVIMKGA
jgi:NAD(P)-dependent dehydrogenase (short-subunit alcohol dehydrogenase family)